MGFPTTTEAQTAILSGKPAEEKPAEKVDDTPAVEDEQPKGDEAADGDAAADAAVAEGEEEAPAADAKADAKADEEKPKPKIKPRSLDGRFADKKVKLDWATKELHRVNAELEAKKAELAGTKPAEKPEPKADEKPAPVEPPKKPTWAEFEAAGKSYDDYLDARDEHVKAVALAEFEAKQAAREKGQTEKQQAEQRAKAQQQVATEHQARIEQAREKYADFDEVIAADVEVSTFVEALMVRSQQGADLMYAVGKDTGIAEALADFAPSRPAFEALLDSDHLVSVLEHLASHPAEQARIARMTPVAQVKALGRLEVELAGAESGSPPAPKPQSKAKPPIQPVVPGPRAAAKDDSDTYTDANADFSKYYRKRIKQGPSVRVR